MRVTKTVREYIERKVWEKVSVKYEAERLEAERQCKIKEDFLQAMQESLEATVRAEIEVLLSENNFLEKRDRTNYVCFYSPLGIKDEYCINSVHKWRERARGEMRAKVDEIIVTLELGGNKADLERLLSEI